MTRHRSPELGAAEGGPIVASDFRAAWWLPSPHLQTLWSSYARLATWPALTRERLELPDGDFLDLDWHGPQGGPIALVLHGLEGSSRSPYARGLLATLARRGWRGVVMHFRGCSGEPNRLDRSYHSGDTVDLAHVVSVLASRAPEVPIAAVGYSLGGNVLLKWLGESGEANPLTAAVAVSVPFDLAAVSARLERGLSRMYLRHLVQSMRSRVTAKFRHRSAPVDLSRHERWTTFRAFDDDVTAPLHGFASADDYYRRSSCRRYLSGIRRPTLILHALDDPFMTEAVVPRAAELAPAVRLEISPRGGHVGFVEGSVPGRARYWTEERIPVFLDGYLAGPTGRSREESARSCPA